MYDEQQVVALHAADGALHHAVVLADAVLLVHDVVAGLQVLEEAGALALARPRLAVCPAPAGEVALGDDGELRRGQQEAAVQRCGDHVAAGLRQVGGVVRGLELEAAFAQQRGEPLGRAVAVGRDDHPVLVDEQFAQARGEPLAVADDGAPAARRHGGGVGVRRGGPKTPKPHVKLS